MKKSLVVTVMSVKILFEILHCNVSSLLIIKTFFAMHVL